MTEDAVIEAIAPLIERVTALECRLKETISVKEHDMVVRRLSARVAYLEGRFGLPPAQPSEIGIETTARTTAIWPSAPTHYNGA